MPLTMPLIVDAHEDLAWNMLTFGRDYTRSAAETRLIEQGTPVPERNGETLLGWPDYQRGHVAVVFSTLFAAPRRAQVGEWDKLAYADIPQANSLYRAQVDAYHRLTDEYPDQFRLLQTKRDLERVLTLWAALPQPSSPNTLEEKMDRRTETEADEAAPSAPVGLVILMEGAEGVRAPGELEEWWQLGVRIIGPAWRGTRFCGGTREPGPLTPEGYALLEAMAALGFTLDLSHMDERAALQAIDAYPGKIIASHANVAALLKGSESNRHLTDRVLRGLLERGGITGIVPFNFFLIAGWKYGEPRATLDHVVTQIDTVCQMAGDARHVGLGSDFDGGYGRRDVPEGVDTIADLQKIGPRLAQKGYTEEDMVAILGGNWLTHLKQMLPEAL